MAKVIAFPYKPQPRQNLFHWTTTSKKYWADEVLYGGAAGGGKSAAIVGDAFKNALKYKGINILILRRTLPELEGSILLTQLEWYPRQVCKYKEQKKVWEFANGSRIWLGYCEQEKDVYRYQGKEFEIIYIDEATHFTETQFKYLKTRNRSSNRDALKAGLKPQMKLTTNPGGVGHAWVKARFIDIGEWEKPHDVELVNEEGQTVTKAGKPVTTRRVFIPAKLSDNKYLDEDYEAKLLAMDEKLRKQLLDGDWDTFDGQYFNEFSRDIHVVDPFPIPDHWKLYTATDYGLDMLATLWIAIDTQGNAYVYKELYESDRIISEAARRMRAVNGGDNIHSWYAPPDLWNRRQETGKSAAAVFMENGVMLRKASNSRIQGWYNVKEWLKPYKTRDEQTGEEITTARMKIFSNCTNLIRTLPQLQHDERDPNDVANEPHELTHAPDALRYFCSERPLHGKKEDKNKRRRPNVVEAFRDEIMAW